MSSRGAEQCRLLPARPPRRSSAPGDQANGDAILRKVAGLKAFVRAQRAAVATNAVKHEWLLAQARLSQEAVGAERDLRSAVEQLAAAKGAPLAAEMHDAWLEATSCDLERQEVEAALLARCRSIGALVRSLREDPPCPPPTKAPSGLLPAAAAALARAAGRRASDGQLVGGEKRQGRRSSSISQVDTRRHSEGGQASDFEGRTEEPPDVSMVREELFSAIADVSAVCTEAQDEERVLCAELRSGWPSALLEGTADSPPSTSGAAECPQWMALLEDLKARFPRACSEAVLREVGGAYEELSNRFGCQLASCREEAERQGSASGGWPPEEHARFVRLRSDALARASRAANPHDAVAAAIACLLPGRSPEAVWEHEDWYCARRRVLERQQVLQESLARQTAQLTAHFTRVLAQEEGRLAQRAAAAAGSEEWAAAQGRLHRHLAALRAERAEREAVESAAAAEEARARSQADALAAQRKQEGRARVLERLAKYREQLAAAEAEQDAQAARLKQAQKEAAAAEAAVNAERVAFRRAEAVQKAEQLRAAAAETERAQQAAQARLAKLRAQVEVHAAADPARLLQPTAANRCSEDATDAVDLFPVHGYTTDQLFKDKRFKVATALRAAGLDKTRSGLQAILSAQPYRAPRPDVRTTDNFLTRNET